MYRNRKRLAEPYIRKFPNDYENFAARKVPRRASSCSAIYAEPRATLVWGFLPAGNVVGVVVKIINPTAA